MAEYKKLLNESFINDATSSKAEDGKTLYIEGVFMGAEKRNRNGRIYPRALIEREVKTFNKLIESNEALGELEHPETSKVNPKEAAIKIISLKMDEDFAIGKAKVLDYMPNGHMLAKLLEDVRMGVSSRGVGDVNESTGIVESNFHLITIDAVYGPSCEAAYVNAVNESYEWVLNESTNLYVEHLVTKTPDEIGALIEPAHKEFQKKLDNQGTKAVTEALKDFMAEWKKISR
jgi:hypothetical protein